MDCTDLAQMRSEATRLYREFNLRRRRARDYAWQSCGHHLHAVFIRPSDFESYLQRRIAKASALIETHIIVHRCQN